MPISEEHIREELKLTPGEEQLIAGSETGYKSEVKYHHQRWWLEVLHLEGATVRT